MIVAGALSNVFAMGEPRHSADWEMSHSSVHINENYSRTPLKDSVEVFSKKFADVYNLQGASMLQNPILYASFYKTQHPTTKQTCALEIVTLFERNDIPTGTINSMTPKIKEWLDTQPLSDSPLHKLIGFQPVNTLSSNGIEFSAPGQMDIWINPMARFAPGPFDKTTYFWITIPCQSIGSSLRISHTTSSGYVIKINSHDGDIILHLPKALIDGVYHH